MSYRLQRPEAVLDVECYPNYFLVMVREIESGRTMAFEQYEGKPLDRVGIANALRTYRVYTFNGRNYDMPMVLLALQGVSNVDLKKVSDQIIAEGLTPWRFEERYGVSVPSFVDHVDLIEVAPGDASLKIYGGRLHSRRMQDLPIRPSARINPEQRELLKRYCGNDLAITIDLRKALAQEIALREVMSDQYGMDLRSKSDAQIAEAVIKSQVEKAIGQRVERPTIEPGTSFHYRVPRFIEFRTPQLQGILDEVRSARFTVGQNGNVLMPDVLNDARIEIGESIYRMGIGGLHSSEKSISHYSDDRYVLIDRDVSSYYPMLILVSKLAPRQLGHAFLRAYKGHVEARLAAKKAGDKVGASSRKIMVNGTFGKLGSPWSVFYAPDLMIQVTVSGQLALLMLIESLELAGISVISANTDGMVARVPRDRIDDFKAIVFDWELATGFDTEETRYVSVHSRDVNNYIAIAEGGKVKVKGVYAPASLAKNPTNEICVDAAVEYLRSGKPIEDTIEECQDIRRFICVRSVRGGAVKNGEYVGKAIRWYYARGERGAIRYQTSGNTVPRTEGARPLMELPDELPNDIDYEWYIREAYGILEDVGARVPERRGVVRRTGFKLARLPEAKNVHTVDLSIETALCGAKLPGRHDKWVEYDTIPSGHRECPKCVRAIGEL